MNVLADPTAKAYAREEIIIRSSVKKVYSIVSEINNWPSWQGNVASAKIEGMPEAGKTFIWKANSLVIKSKLHTVNPYAEIGWTGKIWWISAVHNWKFEETNEGTKVIVEESLKGLGSGTMGKSLTEGMKKNLQELKQEAES
ncbi:MAG: SRPBCC family protein [Bacteroidales bacterium]|nr:SRPBCC family protein [Bacteroidales bacterium]